MMKPDANFYDIQAAFEAEWANKPYEKGKGYKQFKRWEWLMEQRVGPNGELPNPMALHSATKERRAMEAAGSPKAASWTSLGPSTIDPQSYNPGNGRVNVVCEDPNNPSIIYVGTPAGGLWKSINNGISWTPLFDDMITLGVSGIVVDPTNSSIVYAATGDGDGGDMFSIGVVKSTDGGQTWSLTGLNFNSTASRRTHRLVMHPSDNNTLFCAADNGLFKTSDAGVTWTQVQEGNIRDIKIKPGDPTTVYASTDVFLRSTDSGLSFDTIATGLPDPDDVNRMIIGVSPDDVDAVYVLCGDESDASFLGLWRSSDGGSTFTLRSSTPNIFGYSQTGNDGAGQSWYDMALEVDPLHADIVYVGGINVWKSINGGQSWIIRSHWTYPSSIGYTHADIHYLKFFGTRLYCTSDGGIYRSENNAGTWSDLNAGLEIMQFYRMGGSEGDPSLIVAGAQDNGSNIKYSSGWAHVYGADGMEAMVSPTSSLIVFCSYQNGGILRSFDGGQSFNNTVGSISESGAWVTPFMFDPTDPVNIYAGFENLWVSYDLGASWVNLTNFAGGSTIRSLAIAKSNPDYVYFGDRTGYIRKTTNAGANFSIIDQGIPSLTRTYIAVDPNDENVVYVSLGGYDVGEKVYKTTNGGTTWTNISANLPNAPVNCVTVHDGPNGGVYVGTDVGVFYWDTTLSGWQPYNNGLPNTIVSELEINYATSKLRAATFGRGIWETPLYATATAPPTVSFFWDKENICQGDSIQFFDSSLDAAPGWTWSFPGGSPSSSTLQSPKVYYPVSGNYQIMLDMGNSNGTGSFTDNINVSINPHVVHINIVVDDYPSETSWSITDANQNIIGAGGTYDGLASGSTVNDSVCLPDGCYKFEISDSYGDGICCGLGNGSYSVSTMQLGTFATGGDFGSGESTPFCLTGATGIEEINSGFSLQYSGIPGVFDLLDAIGADPIEYALIDASGRILLQTKNPSASGQIRVDLRPFAKGAYLIRVRAGDRVHVLRVTN